MCEWLRRGPRLACLITVIIIDLSGVGPFFNFMLYEGFNLAKVSGMTSPPYSQMKVFEGMSSMATTPNPFFSLINFG